VYAFEYINENQEWLQDQLGDGDDEYYIFDCPGQVTSSLSDCTLESRPGGLFLFLSPPPRTPPTVHGLRAQQTHTFAHPR
jgi:hypothetical protein